MRNHKDSTPFDAGYKSLFSNPRIVQELLEGFVRPEWIDEIDFRTLEPFKASFATDDLRERHDDSIWRVRMREDWLYSGSGQPPIAAHRCGLAKPVVESKI